MALIDLVNALQANVDALRAAIVPPTAFYTAPTDRTVRPKPAPPALGPAGFAFKDPTFGSWLWRATDAQTSNGSSMRVQSNAHAASWSSDGTTFFAMNEGGGANFFHFDGTTVTPRQVAISSQLEPSFSYVHPQLIYGVVQHVVRAWELDTGTVTDIADLDVLYPGLPLANTYVGGFLNADHDTWLVFFGGGGQDQHVFVHHSFNLLLDVRPRGWKIHSASLERGGRFALIYPAVDPATGQLAPGVAQVYIWDTVTGALTPQTVRSGGHDSVGYEELVNQDCCTASAWDASQWQIRSLTAPDVTADLLPAVLTPKEIYLADHTNWRAAKPDVKIPIVSANYRYGAGVDQTVYPWRAWDEEIIAVATDGSGTVWRFAHHQSIVGVTPDFWSEPIVQVAPDGRHAIFTSNWGVPGGRQDCFLVELR